MYQVFENPMPSKLKKNRKTHLLLGCISTAWKANPTPPEYKTTPYWTLFVEVENLLGSTTHKVYVFPHQVPGAVITTLETHTYQNKKYYLECEKRVRGWRLRNWKEISASSS